MRGTSSRASLAWEGIARMALPGRPEEKAWPLAADVAASWFNGLGPSSQLTSMPVSAISATDCSGSLWFSDSWMGPTPSYSSLSELPGDRSKATNSSVSTSSSAKETDFSEDWQEPRRGQQGKSSKGQRCGGAPNPTRRNFLLVGFGAPPQRWPFEDLPCWPRRGSCQSPTSLRSGTVRHGHATRWAQHPWRVGIVG